MNIQRSIIVLFLISSFIIFPTISFADVKSIEERLELLEQEVSILKRQLEIEKEESAKKAKEYTVITASSKDGFSIKSPDESFKLKIRGLIQADGRFFSDNRKDLGTTDTFLIRRARPIFEGTVAKDFDFYLMPDFGNATTQLVDAYLEFKHFKQAKLKAGKFKVPFGLERLQSDAVAPFIEAGLPTNLAPNRDVGLQLSGDLLDERLSYALGFFNGSVDLGSNDQDTNNDKDLAARIFAHPFKDTDTFIKGLGVGFAGTYGHKEGGLPTYKSPGQVNVFSYSSSFADGPQIRLSPQFYFYHNSFGLLGEYITSEQQVSRTSGGSILKEKLDNQSWQVSGSYVFTGESASYKGVTPRRPFNLEEGGWGAVEVVGRYGVLSLDEKIFDLGYASLTTNIEKETAAGIGLNWYLNKNLRLSLDYERTEFDRGAVNGDRKTENAILSRLQLAY